MRLFTATYLPSWLQRHVLLPERLVLALYVVLVAGCATSRVPQDSAPRDELHAPGDVMARIRSQYSRWQGTPHLLGGASARGMDCSAYVQRVFDDAFNLTLPRTTEAQVKEGRRIARHDLRPGDLVFFLPSKTRHVGIYLGNGEFTHASSSEGVTISDLDQSYWKESYWTSRRILADVAHDSQTNIGVPDSDQPELVGPVDATGRRVGW